MVDRIRREPEPVEITIARHIFEGSVSDATEHGEWDLEDAVDFVVERMGSGDFEWNRGCGSKPKFDSRDDVLHSHIRSALSGYY